MGPNRQFASELGPVQPAARELATRMELEKNATFVTEQLMEIVFPDRCGDQAFRELLSRNAYDNLDIIWRIIAGRDELDTNPPFGAIAFSDTAAAIGVPLSQFERIYRVGAGLVWTLWYTAARDCAVTRDVGLDELIGGPSMIIHAYIDGQMSSMLSRYETTQAEHLRTREQLQLSILRQVLDGPAVLGEREIEEALRIRLDGEHIAVAVRSDRSPAETGLDSHIRRVAERCEVLTYRHSVHVWLVWASHANRLDERQLRDLRDVLERSGLRCALGAPARGLSGLGMTGRDALDAARLQDMLGEAAPQVVSYDELRLEAFFLGEPEKARRFVRDELRELDADDCRTVLLRDTARVWLTSGSHVRTAHRLGVHEHTVRNRISQIEALVGGPITRRRTELLVALRLRRMLDGS
ncbi:PucR family transcriptional regulator [Streptomyces sp. cg40]|uniref:PucR family transcriptional regulator n=1 Tax=Streptomyces sp. cg40 TaxID=3419764 RepID=UPI003D0653C6